MKNDKLPFLVLLLLMPLLFNAQTIWDGGGDNLNWNDPLNWSTDAIPSAADLVQINNTLATVSIPIGYSATAKGLLNKGSLTISAMASLSVSGAVLHGIENHGSISNLGEVNVNNSTGNAIWNRITGSFTNAKNITIDAIDATNGIATAGTFDNQASTTITVSHFEYSGITNSSGTFTNWGNITAMHSSMPDAIIYNSDLGLFINETSGVMNLSDGSYGINNYNGDGTFINKGSITITDTGFFGVNNQSIFENWATGTITITNTDPSQIAQLSIIYGEMTNNGTVSVSNVAAGEGMIMYNDTYLKGNGTITLSSYAIIHSHLSPGESPGTLTFNSGLDMSDVTASFEAELQSAVSYDKIVIDGDLTLGCILNVTLLGGFMPDQSDEFLIMTYTGTLTNTFATVNLPSPAMNGWIIDYATAGEIRIKKNPLLPVEWSSFDVVNNTMNVQLIWTTASENQSDYFIIQRSKDVVNWENIAQIEAHGNSQNPNHYRMHDYKPLRGTSFYRLQQVDFNGHQTTSSTLSVSRKNEATNTYLFPNPTNGWIYVDLNSKQIKGVEVYNYLGKLLLFKAHTNAIDLSSLPDGVYYLTIILQNEASPSPSMILKH